jgi:hypothetical protein
MLAGTCDPIVHVGRIGGRLAQKAVAVANAAINMVAGALQTSGGFEGKDRAFEEWMTTSSADVEREITAEKSKSEAPLTPRVASDEELKADITREIDRIFAEAFPTVFKSAA